MKQQAIRLVLLSAALTLSLTASAFAQVSLGGSTGNLGLVSSVWTYFQSNFMEGIILLGVAALGVSMLVLHFHIYTIAKICVGAVILANAVAIAGGLVSLSGG